MTRHMPAWFMIISLLAVADSDTARGQMPPVRLPKIIEPWWSVAGDPDLGPLGDPGQQPVDFAVWQAADGTWQLWSCIRKTRCGGNTRLFYGWEGRQLTDADWRPRGIAMQADTELGETLGGLQAPHVIRVDGMYHMFYGDWQNICHATSRDGKKFGRVVQPGGRTGMFSEGPGNNTRDAMLLEVGGRWHAYYTAFPNRQGAVFCRTTTDFKMWSESTTVAFGGQAGTGPTTAECPFVVLHEGRYYLFRTQRYGADQKTSIYHSTDPRMFGINQDERFCLDWLPVAAPEIILHEGQYYVASLKPTLKGIQIARLQWVPRLN